MTSWRALVPALLALLLISAQVADGAASAGTARARSWALWIRLPGQEVVQIAATDAVMGASPSATGAPIAVGGTAPNRARADADTPEDDQTAQSWLDPTSSMSLEGGGVAARVDASTASARASVGAGSGSGFALADELLTWEQQEQLLGAWGDANAQLIDAVNTALSPLAPVLEPRNLRIPPLEPMAPLGFVDVAGVEQLTSRTQATTSPGFVTAEASVDVSRVRMFGGFIELDGIATAVSSERLGDQDEVGAADVTIGQLRIAGIDVDLSGDGLTAATNDLVDRAILQPLLDAAVEQLAAAGIELHLGSTRTVDGVRQATAFEVNMPTGDGMATVSVGHAEVATTAAPPAADTAPPAAPAPAPDAEPEPAPAPDPPASTTGTAPTAVAAPPSAMSPPRSGPTTSPPAPETAPPPTTVEDDAVPVALRLTPPGPASARSLALGYLLGVGGLLGTAVLVPAVVGWRGSRTLERS